MNLKTILKNKTFLIASGCIIAGLLCAAAFLALQKSSRVTPGSKTVDPARIKIIALTQDSIGVDPKSDFKVICAEKYAESQIRAALTVEPSQPYQLQTASGNDFLIRFENPLKPNCIYKFAINVNDVERKRAWAFQTKKTFRVVRTLPRDKATCVPVKSGIEITFSHDNYRDLDRYFEITPPVEGRFEKHKKTVVFVPKNLAEGTVYTVKLREGVSLEGSQDRLENDYVFQFQTDKKSTETENLSLNNLNTVLARTAPVIRAYSSLKQKDAEIQVEVYKYSDEKRFLANLKKYDSFPSWAYWSDNQVSFDPAGLEKVSSFKTKLVPREYEEFLCFPAPLPEGYYLVNCTTGGLKAQTHIQVNNLVSYINVCKNKTLVWVNNAGTGKPVEGCLVAPENLPPVKTDGNGIAVITEKVPPGENQNNYYFKITSPGSPGLIAVVDGQPDYYYYADYDDGGTWYDSNTYNANNLYWNYLFFDRGLYMPTDTVEVWGVVKSRDKTGQPRKITLELGEPCWEYDEEEPAIEAREVDLTPAGTFTGEFKLPNLSAGSYRIAVKTEDKLITEKYFEVRQYTKPAYKIEVSSDKKAVFQGEPVKMKIQTSFFEGTPVAGLELAYEYRFSASGDWVNGSLTCDKNGAASLQIPSRLLGDSWQPNELSVYLHNARAEEEEVRAQHSVTVFPRDTMIKLDGKRTGEKVVVEVKTNKINLAALNSQPEEYFSVDDYRGAPADLNLEAKIYENYWDKKETGEYYDFINKKTGKKYEYFEVEKLVQKLQFATGNGRYRFEFPFFQNKHYRIEVTGFDTRGRKVVETQEIYGFDYYLNQEVERCHLIADGDKASYKTGEKVSLTIERNDAELNLNHQGRILYLVFRNGLISCTASSSPRYSLSFQEDHIPNIFVQAVWFDGTNLTKIGMKKIEYDHSEKDLQICLETDKKQYKPGETVQVGIKVRDANGSPARAWLNLSVVDEAFFAICDQTVDTRGELYGPCISSGILSDYISHEPLADRPGGGAEQGGEGGDEGNPRSTFKDTAFFQAIETNAAGQAETSFKLPDNLTSWRLTYQGITGDIRAGSGTTNITTKLPFFVDLIFNSVFLEGDAPYLTARAFGTGVDSATEVKYQAVLEDQKGARKSFNLRGRGNRFAGIGLGRLQEGRYSVTVEASAGGYRDAVKKEFQVVKSLLESARVKYKKLVNGYQPEPGTSITTLSFYNSEPSVFYETLDALLYTWGERVDQKLARKRAEELLKQYFKEEFSWNEEFDGKMYQQDDGGLALLPYDSSDPELSAKLSSLDRDRFDRNALSGYFYNILDQEKSVPEAVAASYWGLGALTEPVLLEVKSLLKSQDLDLKQKIYLALALAELGDYDGAEEVYAKVIAANSKHTAPYLYIQYGRDRDDVLDATALCSVLSLKLGAREKYGLFNYVKDSSPKDTLLNLERLMFVSFSLPKSQQTGSFSYELDGTRKDVTLKNIERYKLVLTAEKAAGIKFLDVRGDITVAEIYSGPVKDLMVTGDKLVTLNRTYSLGDVKRNRFKQSDLIKITLEPVFEPNAPDGYYEITDVLPCGLRFVSRRPEDNEWYWYETSGQKIVFGIFREMKKPKPITYYARAVSPGTFTADNAMLKHASSDVAGFTEAAKVSVGE